MNTTQSISTKPGQLRRRLTSALVAFGLVVGTMAMTAKPVEAASSVGACFDHFGSLTSWGIPVNLYALTPSGIVEVPGAGTTTNYNGCATFFVPRDYQRYFLVTWIDFRTYGRYYWGGATAFIPPGYGSYWLPNQIVYCQGDLCNSY